jgi:hypothetical protein
MLFPNKTNKKSFFENEIAATSFWFWCSFAGFLHKICEKYCLISPPRAGNKINVT